MMRSEPTCETCQHFDARFNDCQELAGCLWCKGCQEPFRPRGEFGLDTHCECGEGGTDANLEDVSTGRPAHCPGHKPKPITQTQASLF